MTLSKPLQIGIFWTPADMCKLKDLGVDITVQPDIVNVTFYDVDNCSEFTFDDDPKVYGALCSGGDEYISELSYTALQEAILKHR